jgi:hypothetical protein
VKYDGLRHSIASVSALRNPISRVTFVRRLIPINQVNLNVDRRKGSTAGGNATSDAFPPRFGENFVDEGGLGVGVGFPVGAMHDGKIPLEALLALRFVGTGSEIVPERQVQPLLPSCLGDMDMVGPAHSVGRHAFNEEHPIRLRIFCPEQVAEPLKRFYDCAPRLGKRPDCDKNVDDRLRGPKCFRPTTRSGSRATRRSAASSPNSSGQHGS